MNNSSDGHTWCGGGWQRCEHHWGQITRAQKHGQRCPKQLNVKRRKNVQSKNRSSTMRESWEAYLLYRTRWCWVQRNRSKRRQLCILSLEGPVQGKLRRAWYTKSQVCIHRWGPANLPESVWTELNLNIMKVTFQEMNGFCDLRRDNFMHKFITFRKPRCTNNGNAREKSSEAADESQKQKRG